MRLFLPAMGVCLDVCIRCSHPMTYMYHRHDYLYKQIDSVIYSNEGSLHVLLSSNIQIHRTFLRLVEFKHKTQKYGSSLFFVQESTTYLPINNWTTCRIGIRLFTVKQVCSLPVRVLGRITGARSGKSTHSVACSCSTVHTF